MENDSQQTPVAIISPESLTAAAAVEAAATAATTESAVEEVAENIEQLESVVAHIENQTYEENEKWSNLNNQMLNLQSNLQALTEAQAATAGLLAGLANLPETISQLSAAVAALEKTPPESSQPTPPANLEPLPPVAELMATESAAEAAPENPKARRYHLL